MNKFKSEWKKIFSKDGILKNKRLYIAVAACVGIFAISMAIMMNFQQQDEVLTTSPQQTPTVLPTPEPEFSVLVSPRPTAAPTIAPPPKTAPAAKTAAPTDDAPTAAVGGGTLAQPDKLVMPVVGDVIVPHSMHELIKSKTTGNWQVHRGVDIKASVSTAVLAAADGVVEKAYADDLYGNTIVLTHGGGYQTIYSNLSTLDMVQPGQTIQAGQAISGIGDSAVVELLEEAHLHFELIVNGEQQNPMDLMQ